MKGSIPRWYYDEFKHCGVDFSDPAQVERYDRDHRRIRDYEKDSERVITHLGLNANDRVIDMGCGTGAFALHAARTCRRLYAVDVSRPMLEFCRRKGNAAGLKNIEYCHGGFLTYRHTARPVDAVVSVAVLHHLPDFWKLVGLKRVHAMLKPGGKFYLADVVYNFDIAGYRPRLDDMVQSLARKVGRRFAVEAEVTIRDEYPTMNWIMEGLLRQAGFRIQEACYEGFLGRYLCVA